MNWKTEAVYKLREYNSKKKALTNLEEKIKMKETEITAIRTSQLSQAPSHGTNENTAQDRLISSIAEKDELKLNLAIVRRQIAAIEHGLAELDEEQRTVLDMFFIDRQCGYIGLLCDMLNVEVATVYRKKDEALRKFTVIMYGIIEL